MAQATPLLPEGLSERTATALLRHLEWQSGQFSLVFLFADVGPASALLDWVNERLQVDGLALKPIDPLPSFVDSPEDWLENWLAELPEQTAGAGGVMLMMHRHGGDEVWNKARGRFLSRINERRYLLERDAHCPLLLVFPVAYKDQTRRMAPDLWHVRALSDEVKLPGGGSSMPSQGALDIAKSAGWPEALNAASAASASWDPVAAWHQTVSAAGGETDKVFLPLASDAIRHLISDGRPAEAQLVARQAVGMARDRLRQAPEQAALFRDLMIRLDGLGQVSQAQGDWAGAESVYRESLSLSRQLVERLGGTPESLRDLSVSLNKVGQVSQAQGDWAGAESVYRESLSLSRQLVERLGGTPESLRDLSVSLNKVGQVSQAQDDWAGAESVYRESLSLSRQLVERLGGTPQSLEDLVIGLVRFSKFLKRPALAYLCLWEAHKTLERLMSRSSHAEKYRHWLDDVDQRLAAIEESADDLDTSAEQTNLPDNPSP